MAAMPLQTSLSSDNFKLQTRRLGSTKCRYFQSFSIGVRATLTTIASLCLSKEVSQLLLPNPFDFLQHEVRTLLSGTFINGGTFCGRGKVEGDYDRLLRDEIIESCLTEQRCSVNLSCVTFCFVLLLVRPLCC